MKSNVTITTFEAFNWKSIALCWCRTSTQTFSHLLLGNWSLPESPLKAVRTCQGEEKEGCAPNSAPRKGSGKMVKAQLFAGKS